MTHRDAHVFAAALIRSAKMLYGTERYNAMEPEITQFIKRCPYNAHQLDTGALFWAACDHADKNLRRVMKVELKKDLTKTTLNDIPVGTTFSGTIIGAISGHCCTGVFYKAFGAWKNTHAPAPHPTHDCAVVRLDATSIGPLPTGNVGANLWIRCSVVENYKPLNLKLVEE